jgi:hypothetical protein
MTLMLASVTGVEEAEVAVRHGVDSSVAQPLKTMKTIACVIDLSAMAEDPPKHQQSAKPVPKVDTKFKTGSKGSSPHAPLHEQQLSPDIGTAIDVVHGILGR